MVTLTCVARDGKRATYQCGQDTATVWHHRVQTDDPFYPTKLCVKYEYRGKEYIYDGSSYVAAAMWCFGLPEAHVIHNV